MVEGDGSRAQKAMPKDRKGRLKAALKANIAKRKAQAKRRDAGSKDNRTEQ